MSIGLRAMILATAVATAMAVVAQDLRFQHLTTDNGLSDNSVTSLSEDTDGALLIGTETGLDRFDGTTVQRVNGVKGGVTAAVRDGQGVLWLATLRSGLMRIAQDGTARTFPPKDTATGALNIDQLTALYDLNDTTLLIGSQQFPLIFLDKRTFRFTYWNGSETLSPVYSSDRPEGMVGWCHAIVPLDPDRLWIGLLHAYTSLLVDRRSGSVTRLCLPMRERETYSTAVLVGDVLMLGGWHSQLDTLRGIGSLVGDTVTRKLQGIPLPDEALSLLSWDEHTVLIGTRMSGLVRFDLATGGTKRTARNRNQHNSLPSDRIRCLLKGRNGVLWVGTPQGLAYHDPANWRMEVTDLLDDPQGVAPELLFHRADPLPGAGVRVFTSAGSIQVEEGGKDPVLQRIHIDGKDLQATIIGRDHTGAEILGTEYGLLERRGGRWDIKTNVPDRAKDGGMYQVRGIQADTLHGRPVMIVCALGAGADAFDARTGEYMGKAVPRGMLSRTDRYLVNSMVRTSEGTYWYATNGGLGRWHKDDGLLAQGLFEQRAAPNDEGMFLLNENLRQLLLSNDTVWALSHSGKLYAVANDSCILAASIGSEYRAHGFARDRSGRFWIATSVGLIRCGAFSSEVLHVPINDGRDFRKLSRAITSLDDGRIALCADNRLIRFEPSAFDALPEMSIPYALGAYIADRPAPIQNGSVQLSYNASVIDIALSALQQDGVLPIKFQYRLEGVEDAWHTTAPSERIHYAGVPPGRHDLLVRALDAFGRTGPEHRVLAVTVTTPFWLAWWFYALVAAIVSLAAYAWSRYRIAQALKLQAVRNRIASDLHDEVGSSLSSITIGSQLASSLSPGENHQLQQLLSRIGETSSESLRSMSDIVWAIDPKNDEGDALVKRMQRIANELLESKGIAVSFNVTGGVEDLRLPMTARKEVVLIYKEAVHNVSKYSGASVAQVSVQRRNGTLAVSIKDDGKGFDPALHPDGHGLGSMQRRAAALGTQLILMSAPGMGTLVGVEVDITRIRD